MRQRGMAFCGGETALIFTQEAKIISAPPPRLLNGEEGYDLHRQSLTPRELSRKSKECEESNLRRRRRTQVCQETDKTRKRRRFIRVLNKRL